MENNYQGHTDPNFVPEEFKTPYDILELPSQGILYKNNKKNVKVEYLTAMDESILTSPNIANSGKMVDTLIKRKVKDLNFDDLDLLTGDRMAILLFLRVTAFAEEYSQVVYDEESGDFVDVVIDLSKLKQKKLSIKPDENGEFDFILPQSKKKVTFRLLTGRDENIISEKDESLIKRDPDKLSQKRILTIEQQVMSIDGERDKLKLSNIIRKLSIMDIRKLRNYINEVTPGMDFNTTGRTQGGESIDCFLRFNSTFFWPEI